MGDEFNGNGKKTYLRATQHNTYTPLPQHNIRLTPNFSKFALVATGAIPVGMGSVKEITNIAISKAIGSVASVSQVELEKEKGTGKYRTHIRLRHRALTTGSFLHSKDGSKWKLEEFLKDTVRETVEISSWLIGYKGEPAYEVDKVKSCIEGEEKLFSKDRDNLGDENLKIYGDGRRHIDWYSYEDYIKRDDKNNIILDSEGNEILTINKYVIEQFNEKGQNLVLEKAAEGGFVNGEGRYWVAVGPEILHPGYNTEYEEDKQTLAANHFEYGTEVDVVLQHMETKDLVYIECIIGDVMAHTHPNGVFQTGVPYPKSSNKNEDGRHARNGAYIEFINAPTTIVNGEKKRINGMMSKYAVVKIIIYQREW